MKGKMILHIIAITSFVVFIVLALGSATLTPEEKEALRVQEAEREAARVAAGKGGKIILNFTVPQGFWYHYHLEPSSFAKEQPWAYLSGYTGQAFRTETVTRIFEQDGEYLLRYTRVTQGSDVSRNNSDWRTVRIPLSGYREVRINIP